MNKLTYEKVLREVDYIIKNMPNEIQNKIPSEFIQNIENKMDLSYIPEPFDNSKTIDEQNISKETKKILALIYRNYIVSDKEREQLIIEERKIRQEIEDKKRNIFNSRELFRSRQEKNDVYKQEENNLEIYEFTKTKWYNKILLKILQFFKVK